MSAFQDSVGENGLDTFSDGNDHVLSASPIPENCCGSINYRIRARRVSDGASKIFNLEVGFKRTTGDVVVFGVNVLSTLGTTADLLALSSVTASVAEDGSNINVVANGIAATEIDWGCVTYGIYLQHQ
jgi:hypothetical protein